eukprot:TRINITY_DN11545_c0_g1_i1.p1 TRINITY_DN11545_c0_g1~~TRINITY_DN11545_c0_g1_i1.p1  ORF type:complete len:1257 (-),score=209.03 TRINITY_DN11545_c0_g1_i1:263-3970(-)
MAGGFLAEITTRDDAQTLLYIIYKLNKASKKSTGIFSLGAIAKDGRWVWENSGKEVEVGVGHLLKPASEDVDLFPYPDTFLYLSLYNPPSSSGQDFMKAIPYFDLFVQPGGDAEEEFMCMKKGDGSAATAASVYMEPLESDLLTMKLFDITMVKFNIKIPHGSGSIFKMKFIPSSGLKVCKVKVTHIGSNYPCMADPAKGYRTKGTNSTFLTYESTWKEVGKTVLITSQNLRNYGSGPYLKGYTLDPDTVQVAAFVMGGDTAGGSSQNLKTSRYISSHESNNEVKEVETMAGEFSILDEKNHGKEVPDSIEITATPLDGGLDLIKGQCKRIVFSYKIPTNVRAYVTHSAEVQHAAAGKYVTWCGVFLKKVGENFPCLTPAVIAWSPMPFHERVDYYKYAKYDLPAEWSTGNVQYDAQNTSEFYRYAANVALIQQYPLVNSEDENKIEVEVSIRADKLAAAGTEVKIEFTAFFNGNGDQNFKTDLTLSVVEKTDTNLIPTTYTRAMKNRDVFSGPQLPELHTLENWLGSSYTHEGNVREHIWVPLLIGVPNDGVFPLKVFIEAPVEDNRAILHLTTIRFPITNCTEFPACKEWNAQGETGKKGNNILGVNYWVDLERTYDMQKIKSDRIKTHMQRDQIFVDFGFITNAGYSKMWENEIKSDASRFWIWVGVEISDHPATIDESIHQMHASVFVADQVITKQVNITVKRDASKKQREKTIRPFLDFSLDRVRPAGSSSTGTIMYKQGEVAEFTSIIRHTLTSFGEGYPAFFRIILDQFTGFVVGENYVRTNYTGSDYDGGGVSIIVRDEEERQGSYVDVVFPDGILFPDTIEVAFSVTIDPLLRRKKENNEVISSIKVTALGDASFHGTNGDLYPTSNPIQLASYEVFNIDVQTKDCISEIIFDNPSLQIQSSFVMNWTEISQPANAISNNQSLAWYAPVRSGPYWIENLWLQFDFLTVKRITRFSLSQPDLFRVPTKVRFDYSSSGSSFETGKELSVTDDNKITFSEPIAARFLRVVIIETNDVTENTKPVAINELKIYGCTPENPISQIVQSTLTDDGVEKPQRQKGAEYTLPNKTISSEDVVNYRHYAVDVDNDIIYMCDINPYRPEGGSACWVSKDAGSLWIEQPRYIHNIVGYSPKTGRMYFQDPSGKAFLSSTDGVRMEVLDPTKMDAVLNDTDYPFKPAVNIPGYDIGVLNKGLKITFPGSTYQARYDGIQTSSGQSLARWSSCCGKPAL